MNEGTDAPGHDAVPRFRCAGSGSHLKLIYEAHREVEGGGVERDGGEIGDRVR